MHPDQQQYDLNSKLGQWDSAINRAVTERALRESAPNAEGQSGMPERASGLAPTTRRLPTLFARLMRRSVPPAAASR